MDYELEHHRWFTANALACSAERRIYRAIEMCREGTGPGPTPEELADARLLRQIASDYLERAMKAIWRKPS